MWVFMASCWRLLSNVEPLIPGYSVGQMGASKLGGVLPNRPGIGLSLSHPAHASTTDSMAFGNPERDA
jgi:hypothetical protein